MAGVVGLRFIRAGKVQYFDPGEETFAPSEYAIVESDRGLEVGHVVIAPSQVLMQKTKGPLTKVVRKATPEDLANRDRNKTTAEEFYQEARAVVRELNIEMKIVEGFISLDGSRLTVTYTSEDRIDFRPFLQRLGAKFQGKIDLNQIGPRDHTKVLGGIGRCGRELCCSTWLTEFAPVTMKMAKEQDLPLSPPGLAGVCGRLRCCLRYEYEQYRELKRSLPKIGAKVTTSNGPGIVVVGHPLKQTVTVQLEAGSWAEVSMAELDGSAPPPVPVAAIPSASDGMGRVEPRPEPRDNRPQQPRQDRRDQPRQDRRDDRRGDRRDDRRDNRPQQGRGPQQGPGSQQPQGREPQRPPPPPPPPPPQQGPSGQ